MTDTHSLILSFSDISATDLPLVGGKGANLGEMTHAGFPIPGGFCLTTAAFQQFMDASPDSESIYKQLDTITTKDVETVRRVGEHIRQTLLDVPMPDDIAEAVKQAWQATGTEHAYAVRSSATAEDLPDASFAGQQDTYLNIIGEASLLDAIRRCWVSLFTDRAILYRAQNNFSHRAVQLSVVVQQMIMSETSGTLFTADPLTGQRHTLTIDASFGLGEALVGGLVSPDAYRVDKRNNTIIDRQIEDKKIAIYPEKEGGTRQVTLSDAQRKETVLTDAQILALAELGTKIETHYGVPQDIEWAIADGDLYVLQARPITSLYPIDGLKSPDDSLHIFLSLGHQQSMLNAMAPLGLSTIQVLMPIGHAESVFDNTYIRTSGGRLFADITLPLRHPVLRRAMLGLLSQLDVLAPEAVRQVMQHSEFQRPHGLHINFSVFKGVLKIVRRVWSALWSRDLTGFVDRTNALMDDYIAQVTRSLEALPPGKEQLQAILDALPDFFPFFLNWVPETGAGIAATRILTRLAKRWLTLDELEALTLGIPGNVVNEMNLAIGDLADLARRSPQLVESFEQLGDDGNQWLKQAAQQEGSAPFMAARGDFLFRYGTRGPSEIDIYKPRWYEEPLPVLRVIAEFMNSEEGRHRTHYQSLVKGRQAAIQKLRDTAGAGLFGKIRIRVINRLYHAMTEVGGMREHHKFMVIRLLAVIKEILKSNAIQLAEAKKLGQPDDIWFLTWSELFAIFDDDSTDLNGKIAQRRADLERYEKLTPPMIITSDGEGPVVHYQIEDAPEGALLGNPVSPGVVEGVVHVIRDPQRETLAPGEILVAEFTDPGWTPLFINASGLILEVGGALTHGAVVAREYGIPAIVGVRDATKNLQTGQRVRVDGNRGVIKILRI
jgi:phosphohistidine swiveling domain-containing protein